jgi:hypothetical protein
MSHAIDLKELELKAFRATFDDGLWDMLVGVMALGFALGAWLGNQGWGDFWGPMAMLPLNLLALAGVWLGKRYITIPRAGQVKFSPARNRKIRTLMPAISILLAVSILAGVIVFSWNAGLPGSVLPVIMFAVLWLAIFGLAASWLNVPRFWAYGALLGITYPIGYLMKQSAIWGVRSAFAPFLAAGPIIILVRMMLLLRFVQNYPASMPEDVHDIV